MIVVLHVLGSAFNLRSDRSSFLLMRSLTGAAAASKTKLSKYQYFSFIFFSFKDRTK
jgi:hypothetical protein